MFILPCSNSSPYVTEAYLQKKKSTSWQKNTMWSGQHQWIAIFEPLYGGNRWSLGFAVQRDWLMSWYGCIDGMLYDPWYLQPCIEKDAQKKKEIIVCFVAEERSKQRKKNRNKSEPTHKHK